MHCLIKGSTEYYTLLHLYVNQIEKGGYTHDDGIARRP